MFNQSMLFSFFDEFEKIAATVLMKKLSPAAKSFMERMTGFSHGASIPQASTARGLRHALTSKAAPELMTEMHHMGKLLSPAEQQAKQQAKQHFEGVLQSKGKVYPAVPGTEQQISQIGGHGRAITRTGAEIVPQGTVAAQPRALAAKAQAQRLGAPVRLGQAGIAQTAINPHGATMMAPQMGA